MYFLFISDIFLHRSDIRVEIDIFVPKLNATTGVFIAARMDQGGCTTFVARGVFFFLLFGTRSRVVISNDYGRAHSVSIYFAY